MTTLHSEAQGSMKGAASVQWQREGRITIKEILTKNPESWINSESISRWQRKGPGQGRPGFTESRDIGSFFSLLSELKQIIVMLWGFGCFFSWIIPHYFSLLFLAKLLTKKIKLINPQNKYGSALSRIQMVVWIWLIFFFFFVYAW